MTTQIAFPAHHTNLSDSLETVLQALVYHNKKCIGRFVKPRLYSVSQLGDTSSASDFQNCPVQQLSIIYDCFKAACSDTPGKVSVPIVTASSSEHYQFTVVGRCEERNFVLPATYQFSGQQAAYKLQKTLYTTKHQQATAAGSDSALSPLITNSDLTLNLGTSYSTACDIQSTVLCSCFACDAVLNAISVCRHRA